MPVVPVPCTPAGGDGGGGEAGEGCCAPSLAASPLCLPDGQLVLVVLRAACAACGGDADPEVAGWVDPASGVFTPGAVPEDAGPCESGGGSGGGQECAAVSTLRLCDLLDGGEQQPFLRHVVRDCDGTVAAVVDTAADGVTTYTPAGEVGECPEAPPPGAQPCEPVAMCPQLVGLAGPETWEMPDGAESVSLSVVCGPVTVTDCTGHETRINECGANVSWSAPGGGCAPGVLCGPLTVEVPEGAAAYIHLLSPCGDAS